MVLRAAEPQYDEPTVTSCWCTGTSLLVYFSHFLSSWGDRMWLFAVGLFLVIINPDSLQLTASYGLTLGLSLLLFGALLGDWVDHTPRLRAAQVTLVIQNLVIVACAVVLLLYLIYQDELLAELPWMEFVSYGLIILLSATANLASKANTIAVERDWIVEICDRDEDRLATMTATMKAIDKTTQILAPILSGFIMTYAGSKIGAVFIGGWNLVSCGVEYYLLHKVFHTVPALRKKKDARRSDEHKTGPETDEKKSSCKMFSSLIIIFRGWRTYMGYKVCLSGLALAFLYMTVLGFDNVTIGYAKIQGLSESIISIFQACGGLFGIPGTLIYPRLRSRVGLSKSALMALIMLVLSLTPSLVSVWLPGSKFDLFGSQTSENCTTTVETSDFNSSSTSSPQLVTSSPQLVTSSPSCSTEQVSVYVMLVGIVMARTGLWVADLSITQMFLETVLESERGVVNGVQTSLNQMMDMVKFVLVLILPFANQFGLLVILSYLFVFTGAVLQGVFVYRERRQHEQS